MNEYYLNCHFDNFKEANKNLLYLLRATRNNKDNNVIQLRKQVLKYIQDNEKYIVELELDNFEAQVYLRDNNLPEKFWDAVFFVYTRPIAELCQ